MFKYIYILIRCLIFDDSRKLNPSFDLYAHLEENMKARLKHSSTNLKLTQSSQFHTIESLHCIVQEFASERDFTWKLLYNFISQDGLRETLDM